MSKKKFTIECEMEKRWIDYFCTMLKNMEYNGNIGHSEIVAFYSDGDGDFRPTFDIKTKYTTVSPTDIPENTSNGRMYDAG